MHMSTSRQGQAKISRRALIADALFASIAGLTALTWFDRSSSAAISGPEPTIVHTDAEWRRILTPTQFAILRHSATEPSFHNSFWNNHAKGDYLCAGCDQMLFNSSTKFDSGTGWPSFWAPATKTAVVTGPDDSFGVERTEVKCGRCWGHLGHLFDDGPRPTGLRYCMNSGAMKFIPTLSHH